MWEELKQIALLGTNKSQLTETQLDILKRFGIDCTKETSLVALDALALWSKLKAVGIECENWEHESMPAIGTRTQFASASLSNQVGVMFKYKGYEKLLPEVFEKLLETDTNFPAEHLPKLMQALKADPSLFFKIEQGLDDRFYWLAKQQPDWKLFCVEDPAKDINRSKVLEEKKQILLLWLHKDPIEAINFLNQGNNNFSADFWKQLLEEYYGFEPNIGSSFVPILETLIGQKNKRHYGICCMMMMSFPETNFASTLYDKLSKIILVSEDEIGINEKEIDALKTLIPKNCLPFSLLKTREKIFDKNLFFHALSIASPEILFDKYFKMGVDDFINTTTHLGFYDELIIQGMIYSASRFRFAPLLNGLIKLFRTGSFPDCNWKPILDLLPPKALNVELNLLLKEADYRFDHRMAHLFFADQFNWPAKAVQYFTEVLSAQLDQQKLGKRDFYFKLFEEMTLKCHPNFYYELKSELVTNRVFSFHSNSLIEKQLNLLKLRLEFFKEVSSTSK